MKLLTAIFAVLCLGLSAASSDVPVELLCMDHIFSMYMEELGRALENNIAEDNQELGKYLLCVYQGYGVISEDGTFNEKSFHKYLADNLKGKDPKEVNYATADSLVKNCKDVVVEDLKRTAIRLSNCVIKIVK